MDASPLAALDALIADASPSERAALIVQLAARLAALGAKLGAPAPDNLLEAEEAAAIAKVPVRRVWSWARAKDAKDWAVHLGPRTLRVREQPFRQYWEKKCLNWARAHGRGARRRRRSRGRDDGSG